MAQNDQKYIYWFIGIVAIVVLVKSQSKDWQGYAYPDKYNLSKVVDAGKYKTEDDCIMGTVAVLYEKQSNTVNGDYECHKE